MLQSHTTSKNCSITESRKNASCNDYKENNMADRSILQEYLAQRKDRAQAKIKNPVPSLKMLFEMNVENTEESKEESSALSQFFDMSIKNFAYIKDA